MDSIPHTNRFFECLRRTSEGGSVGSFVMSASPLIAEALGCSGLDWLILDAEHSPLDMGSLVHLLQAVETTPSVPVVRVPWNEPVVIKRVLDAGSDTLLVPFVENAQQAEAAVRATRYPPQGIRGMAGLSRSSRFGARARHFETANARQAIIVQLETPGALEQLEAIAGVEGVDALFIGPTDLAGAMGLHGNGQHPRVQEALQNARERSQALGMPIGTLAPTAEAARRLLAAGFSFVALSSDLGLLLGATRAALDQARKAATLTGPPGGAY